MKNIFYAVVVIYNKEIPNSKTCKNLRTINGYDIRPIIVDNSTESNNNALTCNENRWTYISMDGNAGLSKAYNRALETLNGKEGIVVWLDDDSNVTQEYFDALDTAVNNEQSCDVFAPIIQGQDGHFWSPNEYRFFRNRQLKSVDDFIDDSKFNAINSCTAVRLRVYKHYRYDERLFLDQVDHKLFLDLRNKGIHFKKLRVIIQHNFSTKDKIKNYATVKKRYEIMIPDFLIFCSDTKLHLALAWLKVAGWGIRVGLRYRKPGFLFWCLSKAARVNVDIEQK